MEDYCHGQLIPHKDSGSQNDMTRCRTPAAYSAVVPTVKITQRHLCINPQCAVCLDLFAFGGEAREMPCMHMYHAGCILPWLAQNNSCPVCPHEFPEEGAYGRGISESCNTSSSEAHGDLIFGLPAVVLPLRLAPVAAPARTMQAPPEIPL